MKKRFIFRFLAILITGTTFASDKKEVASQWRSAEIKIDGVSDEWSGALTYLEKEKLAYAIKNDSSDIYLCLEFDTAIQRQATMFGFTVWFDASGKEKKTFGVRFPIGLFNVDGASMPDPMAMRENPEAFQSQVAQMRREIEVIGPEKDDRNRFSIGSFGMQAVCVEAPGTLICELKIPLAVATGHPYAIGAAAGKTLSVGFEMGEMNREKMRERMGQRGGGRPSGGMPPGGGFPGGGRPGGMGGGFPGGRPDQGEMFKAFKTWLRVTLAATK
jgi:uncharacterized membrane protein YgcG